MNRPASPLAPRRAPIRRIAFAVRFLAVQTTHGVSSVLARSVLARSVAWTPPRAGIGGRQQSGRWLALTSLAFGVALCHSAGMAQEGTGGQRPDASKSLRGEVVVSEEAQAIHAQHYLFDGHNDLPWLIRTEASRSFENYDIAEVQLAGHTDIPRLRAGGVGAQYWSVYVPANTVESGISHQMTLEQIEIVHAMLAKYPETFELALTRADIDRIRAKGKIASLIGVEGGHAIENSLEKLRRLYALGARYMTLTHSKSLDWADSCTDEPRSGGLSEFGKEVVHEMNRLGMLVDLSHVSPATMQAAMDVSEAPVIFSHSSARGVADHVRNVPDDILKQLPADGGVVMVNFYSGFVVPESAARSLSKFERSPETREKYGDDQAAIAKAAAAYRLANPLLPGSVHDVADHIDRIVKLAGIDHVGIGSDFDGIDVVPHQLEDVSKYPMLTQVLLDRGYSEEDLVKILHGNILRVIEQAELVSQRLQESTSQGLPEKP